MASGAETAYLPDRTIQRKLLEGSTSMHREMVAFSLDLPRKSSASAIAERFRDEARAAEIIDQLPGSARRLLVRAVFDDTGEVLSLSESQFRMRWERERSAAVAELERYGFAFAFVVPGKLVYHVPADLRVTLRRAITAQYARSVRRIRGAQTWLAVVQQDLEDAVDLWIELARAPAPLTYDGEIKRNSKRRLLGALSTVNFPYPDDTLSECRFELAIRLLRDGGYLRVAGDGRVGIEKMRLEASGDLVNGLSEDPIFERFPTGDFRDGHVRLRDLVQFAHALGGALAGQSVSLASFGQVLRTLVQDAAGIGALTDDSQAPSLALRAILPGWLRGELHVGLSRGKPTAIRFPHSERRRRRDVRALADRVRKTAVSESHTAQEDASGDEDEFRFHHGAHKWYPIELPRAIGKYRILLDEADQDVTLVSAIDIRSQELLMSVASTR